MAISTVACGKLDGIKQRPPADAWQLLSEHHVENTGASDLGRHAHHLRMTGDDFANDYGILAPCECLRIR